jgi:NAD(P)-dependent dehydrogenase (short-subunit alcohol dehydrogenase family)
MDQHQRLSGKVALFAGAGGGMGAATPLLFAQQGARIVLAARRAEPLQELAARIVAVGGEASIVTGDLTTEAAMSQAVAHAEARFGRLDIAFNNLGDFAFHTVPAEETTEAQWDYLTTMNLKTAFLLTHCAVPALQRAGRGVLIHLAASGDVRAMSHPGYAAAKLGLIGFTRRTAVAYRPRNIRVICLCPSGMGNQFAHSQVGLPDPRLTRGGSAEDLAWAALFFASDEASWLTGVCVDVDGANSLTGMSSA